MRGLFPRDPLLVGRFGAGLGALGWLWLGGPGIVPIAAVALVLLLATAVRVWWLNRRSGRVLRLHEIPVHIVIADLVTAGLWMIGSASNPRSLRVPCCIPGNFATSSAAVIT